ncbi:MAG: cupin domain-containing protein [Microcoleaceae cyanobacterium]
MELQKRSELAALAALDALDGEERIWAENYGIEFPELEVEIEDFKAVIAQLAYGAPSVPMAANLKDRLFQRITPKSELVQTVAEATETDDLNIAELLRQSQTVKWRPYPGLPELLLGKLRINPETRQIDCFIRSWGQGAFPLHRHAATEEMILLEGDLVIGDRLYGRGDRICSDPNTVHQPKTQNGCLVFIRSSLDNEIL